MWRNRLLALASEERPDGRELDAIVAVYAALFGQQVTKLRVDVMRPMRGHFVEVRWVARPRTPLVPGWLLT